MYLPAGECYGQQERAGEQYRTAAQFGSSRHLNRHLPELRPNPLQHHRPATANSSRENRSEGKRSGSQQNTRRTNRSDTRHASAFPEGRGLGEGASLNYTRVHARGLSVFVVQFI